MEEIQLVKSIQEGDIEALGKIFELYKHRALRTAYLITGDKYISEDIVQEAFVQCYFSVKDLRKPEYFKTWFFKMLTRMAWRSIKKEKKIIPTEEIMEKIDLKENNYSLEEGFVQAEQDKKIYKEISKLDLKHQTTIILYYYNELSIKEIAKVMGCLEGTVKSRMHNARNKLKDALEKLDEKESSNREERGTFEIYKTI